MPRRKRSYLPGCAFHITARTHGQEFWFEDIRSEIVGIVDGAVQRTDVELLAFAIMTNHLHLIVRQGAEPLGQTMHAVCQRTAYAVHRRLDRKGYVMGYRYFDTPCLDDAHLRNAILYTHRNAVAAGMCTDPRKYGWSSDAAYRGEQPESGPTCSVLRPALSLFASGLQDRTPQQDYADFYTWYDTCKQLKDDDLLPRMPGVSVGDEFWMRNAGAAQATSSMVRRDLRDIVRSALDSLKSPMPMDELRTGGRSRAVCATRNAVIARAIQAGCRQADIARFLNVSESVVSSARQRSGGP